MNGGAGTPLDRFRIVVITCAVLLILGALTYERHRIEVDPSEPGVYSVTTTWWGLKESVTEIRWMKPPGYDYRAWCASDRSGKWYPYIVEPVYDDYGEVAPGF